MGLEQIEKLGNLVKKLINNNREARFKVARLEKEISELKIQMSKLESVAQGSDNVFVQDLLTENERLKTKNQTVRGRLDAMVAELEQKIAQ